MKPTLQMENGMLVARASAGVDSDKDGIQSVSASVEIKIDPMEAVNEIIKGEVPEWLKKLVGSKSEG